MTEELELIKNFIIEHNLIQLIMLIGIPFTLFHLFLKLIHSFTYQIKKDVTKDDFTFDFIQDELKQSFKDVIVSNENFIKY